MRRPAVAPGNRRVGRAACLGAALTLVSVTGCGVKEVCVEADLVAQPGQLVDRQGDRHLELVARFTDGGTGIADAPIEFGLQWEQAALLVADVKTDASGRATFRSGYSSLELDVRMKGRFKEPWIARFDNQAPVGDVAYCEARATAGLPLSDLPRG